VSASFEDEQHMLHAALFSFIFRKYKFTYFLYLINDFHSFIGLFFCHKRHSSSRMDDFFQMINYDFGFIWKSSVVFLIFFESLGTFFHFVTAFCEESYFMMKLKLLITSMEKLKNEKNTSRYS
jgi:hypothetical protein